LQPLPLLHEATLNILRHHKNLLAFSGGGDSTALFFLLQEQGILFDVALVNYKTRAQSDEEEAYAKALCQRYHKQCFIFTCKVETSNFEHLARSKRYTFFETIISIYAYDNLLSAHHLGDRLEWFLMQLSKGAGLVEMLGMQAIEQRTYYTLVRPLLHVTKTSLLAFLQTHNHHYFNDESNQSMDHMRNRFRHHFAAPLLETYEKGIAQSFLYMEEDAKRLLSAPPMRLKDLFILTRDCDDLLNIRQIDKVLKLLGKIPTSAERQEILRTKECVIGGKVAICFQKEVIFMAPYCTVSMPKPFKEACRKAKVPSKIRPYLFSSQLNPLALHSNHTL